MVNDPSTSSADPGQPGDVAPRNDPVAGEHTTGRRVGIRVQTYLGLFGSVLLVTMASVVAYVFLNQIVQYQSRLAQDSIPNLSRAVEVARQSTNLVQSVVRMVSASTPAEHQSVADEVLQGRQELIGMVEAIGAMEIFSEQAHQLSLRLDTLEALLNEIEESSGRRLVIRAFLEGLVNELGMINKSLERSTGAAIDDQGFFLATGLRNLDDVAEPLSQRDWDNELAHYRDLIEINDQTTIAGLLLGEALVLADRDLLGSHRGEIPERRAEHHARQREVGAAPGPGRVGGGRAPARRDRQC